MDSLSAHGSKGPGGTVKPFEIYTQEELKSQRQGNRALRKSHDSAKLWRTFFKGLGFMLNLDCLFMSFLTCIAIFLVSERVFNITFKVEFSVFSAGVIFPTTFSVQAAFQRREEAMQQLAKLKSNISALFSHFQYYDVGGKGESVREIKPVFDRLISNLEIYLRNDRQSQVTSTVMAPGGQQGADSAAHFIYDDFALIAEGLQDHTTKYFGYPQGGKPVAGPTSRSWQFLQDSIVAFEKLRAIRVTRTPEGLRLFCYFLINVSCIALAPYWAHFCKNEHFTGEELDGIEDTLELGPQLGWIADNQGYGCASAYLIGILFTLIVLTLYSVQSELEDPFDGRGLDDINIAAWRLQITELGLHGPDGPVLREKERPIGSPET